MRAAKFNIVTGVVLLLNEADMWVYLVKAVNRDSWLLIALYIIYKIRCSWLAALQLK